MAKIHVHTAFKLNRNGEHADFPVGIHDVDDDVAGHWFVKHHSQSSEEASTEAEADKKGAGKKAPDGDGKAEADKKGAGKKAPDGDGKAEADKKG